MRSEGQDQREIPSFPNLSLVQPLTATVLICPFKPRKEINHQVRTILAAPSDTSQEEKLPLWEEEASLCLRNRGLGSSAQPGEHLTSGTRSKFDSQAAPEQCQVLFSQPQARQPGSPEHREHLQLGSGALSSAQRQPLLCAGQEN